MLHIESKDFLKEVVDAAFAEIDQGDNPGQSVVYVPAFYIVSTLIHYPICVCKTRERAIEAIIQYLTDKFEASATEENFSLIRMFFRTNDIAILSTPKWKELRLYIFEVTRDDTLERWELCEHELDENSDSAGRIGIFTSTEDAAEAGYMIANMRYGEKRAKKVRNKLADGRDADVSGGERAVAVTYPVSAVVYRDMAINRFTINDIL